MNEIQRFKDELQSGLSGMIDNKMDQSTFMQAALQFANDVKIQDVLKSDLGRSSIIGAMLKAAMFGFSLAPEMGQCYVVPRSINTKQKKTDPDSYVTVYVFQIGYKGWQDLAFSSDAVLYFDYGTVYEKDQFEVTKGINQNLVHVPFVGSPEGRGRITHFYATACLSNGIQVFDYISIQDAEKYRQMSDTQYDGYGRDKTFSKDPKGIWAKHYDQMALRLPFRNICTKKIRRSPRIANAVLSDGGTSYVQDGKTLELTPNEIMALERPTIEIGIAPDLIPRYQDLQDGLMGLTDFDSVLNYYTTQFKESDLADNRNFAKLIFDRVCEVVKTVKELGDFFHSVKDVWKDDKELMKIISRKKQDLENAK